MNEDFEIELADSTRHLVEVVRGVVEISSRMDGCEHVVIASALESAMAPVEERLRKIDA